MKIIFIADVPILNPISGSETVLHKQAIFFSQEGLYVYAITRSNGSLADIEIREVNGVKEACYSANVGNLLFFLFAIFKKPIKIFNQFLSKTNFLAAICHQPFTCFPLLISRKISGIPLIYVFHSPNHEEYKLSSNYKKEIFIFFQSVARRIVEQFCLKRTYKIMVLSHYMKNKVMDIHGIAEERIVINPGGVDLEFFQPLENRSKIKEELGFHAKKIHLLTIRNLEPRMGLDNLIKAIFLCKKKWENLYLTIGGDGPEKETLENMIKVNGLLNDISMTGFIKSEELPKYYGAADFFILPTRHLEGFGLVTVESLACGTPVLGTPVGGTKEILSKFEPRLLFKSSTPEAIAGGIKMAIETYYNDKIKYEQLRLRCREYAEKHYSWQRHVDQLRSIIYELVNKDELKN